MILLATAALAAPAAPPQEIVIEGARHVELPCRTYAGSLSVGAWPVRVPDELLRAMPGLHTASLVGQGGALNYLYRGFASGNGRDLAVSLDGVPLNEPSHLHDPGWVDLTFLPRVLLRSMDLCTGPPLTGGSFGTAGAVDLGVGLADEGLTVRLGGGTDGSGTASVAWRPPTWGRGTWIAGEVEGGEGVSGARSWRHVRLSGGVEGTSGEVNGRVFVMLYDGLFDVPTWLSSDDLKDGDVRFYGNYRSWQGEAASRRLLLSGRLSRPWSWGGLQIGAWLGARGFRLRENLTGFLEDDLRSDAFQQRQSTFDIGLNAKIQRTWSIWDDLTLLEGGVDLRTHFLRQREDSIEPSYEVVQSLLDRRVQDSSLAAWLRLRVGLFRRLSLESAVRLEDVDLRMTEQVDQPISDAPRSVALVAAPRVAVRATPVRLLQLWGAWGRGFRPPDGRSISAQGLVPVTRVDTLQGGFIGLPFPRVRVEGTAFAAWSPSEPIHDERTGEVVLWDATRRYGGEGVLSVFPVPQVRVSVEASGADTALVGAGGSIPWTMPWLVTASAWADRRRVGPVALSGGLRFGLVGPRLVPGGHVPVGFTADLAARVDYGRWSFDLAVDQLIPVRREEAAAWFPSSWDPGAPVSDLPIKHVIAGEPFALTLGLGARF